MPKPGPATVLALTVAIVSISSSAPMIAACAAPALAVAFWRNALAVGVLAPVAATRNRRELRGLSRSTLLGCALAGLWLAVHFGTWIPSAKMTTAAMSTALVNTTPVWTALFAVLRGTRIAATTWLGIGVAVAGTALAAGADLGGADGRALLGDGLALAGGFAAAVYTTIGERVRVSTSTTAYTTVCYSVCALGLLAADLIGRVPLVGFPPAAWLLIAGMTLGPQLLGHSLVNFSLRRVSAATIAVLLLLEVPGAALIAWLALHQLPAARSLPGLALLLVGVSIVVFAGRTRPPNGGTDQPTNGGTAISPDAIATT